MSRNLFDQLPICVCQMQNLETLSLKYNKLVNLPTDAEILINLKVSTILLNHKKWLFAFSMSKRNEKRSSKAAERLENTVQLKNLHPLAHSDELLRI